MSVDRKLDFSDRWWLSIMQIEMLCREPRVGVYLRRMRMADTKLISRNRLWCPYRLKAPFGPMSEYVLHMFAHRCLFIKRAKTP